MYELIATGHKDKPSKFMSPQWSELDFEKERSGDVFDGIT